jgi:hypothetical protein
LCIVTSADTVQRTVISFRHRGTAVPTGFVDLGATIMSPCETIYQYITCISVPYTLFAPVGAIISQGFFADVRTVRVDVAPPPLAPPPFFSDGGAMLRPSRASIEVTWEPDPFTRDFGSIDREEDEIVAAALCLDVHFSSPDDEPRKGEVVLPPLREEQSRINIALFATRREWCRLPKQYVAYVAVRLTLIHGGARVRFEMENVTLT